MDGYTYRGKDLVRFFLTKVNFNGKNFSSSQMARVLAEAFGVESSEAFDLFDRNPEGFWVTCRPAQFGRFIALVANDSGVNGVRDLKPELIRVGTRWTPEREVVLRSRERGSYVTESQARAMLESLESYTLHATDARQSEVEVFERPSGD